MRRDRHQFRLSCQQDRGPGSRIGDDEGPRQDGDDHETDRRGRRQAGHGQDPPRLGRGQQDHRGSGRKAPGHRRQGTHDPRADPLPDVQGRG